MDVEHNEANTATGSQSSARRRKQPSRQDDPKDNVDATKVERKNHEDEEGEAAQYDEDGEDTRGTAENFGDDGEDDEENEDDASFTPQDLLDSVRDKMMAQLRLQKDSSSWPATKAAFAKLVNSDTLKVKQQIKPEILFEILRCLQTFEVQSDTELVKYNEKVISSPPKFDQPRPELAGPLKQSFKMLAARQQLNTLPDNKDGLITALETCTHVEYALDSQELLDELEIQNYVTVKGDKIVWSSKKVLAGPKKDVDWKMLLGTLLLLLMITPSLISWLK